MDLTDCLLRLNLTDWQTVAGRYIYYITVPVDVESDTGYSPDSNNNGVLTRKQRDGTDRDWDIH